MSPATRSPPARILAGIPVRIPSRIRVPAGAGGREGQEAGHEGRSAYAGGPDQDRGLHGRCDRAGVRPLVECRQRPAVAGGRAGDAPNPPRSGA